MSNSPVCIDTPFAGRDDRRALTARAAIGTVVAVIAAAVLLPATASAATVTVNTQADHNDKFCDLADCTLREAVELGANTINLPKGHYTLTLGELDLVNDEIDGAGARAAILTATTQAGSCASSTVRRPSRASP